MCGLYGVAQQQNLALCQIKRLKEAGESLIHRGPDSSGYWKKNGVFLGHHRLSIIDTSRVADQPMLQDRVVITVNGEIYNFKRLRRELEQQGAVFKSHSDSEVILHGYRLWGVKRLLGSLEGMYSVVIYDQDKGKIFLIRDRVGIKPLYYHLNKGALSWASELKALVAYIEEPALSVDTTALLDFLVYRYIPAPKSLYKGVFKLPAAHYAEFDIKTSKLSIRKYWQLPLLKNIDTDEAIAEQLVDLLSESVQEQSVSDIPLGVLLSGGIDSSALVALSDPDKKILSFSASFKDSSKDESLFASMVAKHVGIQHNTIIFPEGDMSHLSEKMAAWFGEPFGDTSAVPTYLVSRFAKEKVGVVLGGDGGDELFGGYVWYRKYRLLRNIQRFIPFLKLFNLRIFSRIPKTGFFELLLISDPVELYARLRKSLSKKQLDKWKERLGLSKEYDPYWAYRNHYKSNLSPAMAARVMDFHTYLPDDILVKVDRISMSVSLECRPPFLSTKLIEYAFSLPESFIYKGGQLKGGLKYSLKGVLPEEIITRKKQGFSVPDFGWRKDISERYGSMQEFLIKRFVERDL